MVLCSEMLNIINLMQFNNKPDSGVAIYKQSPQPQASLPPGTLPTERLSASTLYLAL